MSRPPEVVGLVSARHRADAGDAARRSLDWLEAHGLKVALEPETARLLDRDRDPRGDWLRSDLILVFGGDGTVISALRAASGRGVPVIAVNFGTVGFLTEINASNLSQALEAVVAGEFEIETRLMLEACVTSADGSAGACEVCANDVVIKAADPTHVLEFRVRADGYLIAEFPADGLILSTPTGSTAYSLSAGGPVVVPGLAALVLTPICPHTLATRPIVLAEETVIEVDVSAVGRNRMAAIAVDGRINLDLVPGSVLKVKRAEQTMKLARLRRDAFFDSLRGKLRWGSPK